MLPPVYRFLCDDEPPPAEAIAAWIEESLTSRCAYHGLWLLEDEGDALAGCVRMEPVEDGSASAELTYVLHPERWGRGTATRMAATAIAFAFGRGASAVLAGADAPNEASFRVMERLGMEPLRTVAYPAGPGEERILRRGDAARLDEIALIAFDDSVASPG